MLWLNLGYRKQLPPHTTFHQSRMIFLSYDMHQSRAHVGCHATGNNSLSIFFTLFLLLISIVLCHKSKMINGFTIRVVKIIIIKVSIIKHYAIAKEYNRVYIMSESILPKIISPCGTVVYYLSLLHTFIQLSLNSGSGKVQNLLAAC